MKEEFSDGRPKKHFTPEFRAEAVRLAQTSGRSRHAVAEDLGIGLSTFRHQTTNQHQSNEGAGAAHMGMVTPEA